MYSVELKKLVEKMQLENCTPEIDISHILIKHPDVNRPALQLAGFFDYFDAERVQIIGNVEHAYMEKMEKDHGISGYYLYGLVFPQIEHNETLRYTLWSVVTWLWFMSGVWSLYAIARHMGLSSVLSCTSALLLYLSPRFFADGHLNNKDVVLL